MSIVITVANQKGGVGKTTTVIELSACMANLGYKTLAIDLDQQLNLSTYLSDTDMSKPTIYDVLKDDKDIMGAIQNVENFDMIIGSSSLSKCDSDFNEPTDVLKLKKILEPLKDIYDFIFIDTNPSRNTLLNMCYIASNYFIIPVEADRGSEIGINQLLFDLDKYVEIGWSLAKVLAIIVTRKEKNGVANFVLDNLQNTIINQYPDIDVYTIRKSVVASEAKYEGTSMQKGKKYSNPAIDYRKVAKSILEKILKEIDE